MIAPRPNPVVAPLAALRALAPLAALLGGCPGDPPVETETDPPVQLVGPELVHTPIDGPVNEGTPVELVATAEDVEDGVFRVVAFARAVGGPVYEPFTLEDQGDGTFVGTIPGTRVQAPGLEYYLRAEDGSEFRVPTFLPEGAADAPIVVPVEVVGAPLPFVEGFEGAADALTVFDLGWTEVSTGFAASPWEITPTRAASGGWSVVHRPGAEGLPESVDWLISPPLAIEGPGPFAVSWMEYGDATERADHSLWISTTTADPREGSFTELASLPPPPEDRWGRSPMVELPEAVRGQHVYLAWRYVGQAADTWYVDDVRVGDLGPDVDLVDLDWTRVDPGGRATLTLSLENRTRIAAEELVITGTVGEGAGAFVATQTVDLPGEEALAVDLLLDVDAAWPDNSRLPLTLSASLGEQVWTWEREIVVGDPSRGRVSIVTSTRALAQVVIGAGPPEAPRFRQTVTSGVLDPGSWTFSVDLTDRAALLPPEPGPDRWWLELTGPSAFELVGFEIDFDGQTFRGVDLGTARGGLTTRFWLPEPPAPALTQRSTTPASLAPGDDATLTLTVRNDGAPTLGRTVLSVGSLDPDVVVYTTDPILLAEDGWPGGASVSVDVEIGILESQRDARPAALEIEIVDALEAWTLPTSVSVPWPVLAVQGVAIDDFSDGDDDGLLDPFERVLLDVTLSNVGTRATFASVQCTASAVGGDASARLIDATGGFRALGPGERDSEDDFEIELTAGDVGDALELALACTDGTTTYDLRADVVVGERPWLGLSGGNDPIGDALGGYGFDLVNGSWRVEGGALQLRVQSADAYDPATSFVEMWFQSPGADFTYYQAVAQSGSGSLRGYRFGFTPLDPDPIVTAVDDTTLQIDLPLAPLGLAANRVEIGFAAGFCGGTAYFCDHFPNGWGDPYNAGLNTFLWIPLTW